MPKLKAVYICQDCGASSPKWAGQCADCGRWNTLIEEVVDIAGVAAGAPRPGSLLPETASEVVSLTKASAQDLKRLPTGIGEVERMLGGGLVPGQAVLLAGPPGIGKSTLMLQLAAGFEGGRGSVLYASGEESLAQVSSRASRLGIKSDSISLLSATNLAAVLQAAKERKPRLLVVDSIQAVYHPELAGAAGTVGQVRACAAELLKLAKGQDTVLFVLGHVTKEGTLAGPKVLEHLVDTVLSFEAERHREWRLLRASKNRFGPTSEIGVFEMTDKGLREIPVDDARLDLSAAGGGLAGRAVAVAAEGTRPFLAEVQALAVATRYPYPRRMASGLDLNRTLVLLAALEKHLRLRLDGRDVYVNLAGGLRFRDPALDLASVFAVASSAKDIPVPSEWVFIGEVGLLGELRGAPMMTERLKAAERAGFKKALVAKKALAGLSKPKHLQVVGAERLADAFQAVFGAVPAPERRLGEVPPPLKAVTVPADPEQEDDFGPETEAA